MEPRPLGRTGASVSVLGFGGMELRGPPRAPALTDAEASALMHAVLDAGITLVDTSIDYGASEEVIGRTLASRRGEYFLCSKCGCSLDPRAGESGPYPHDWRPEVVRAGIDRSLRRLATDHLDLLQVHMSPSRARMGEERTVETLQALRDEGKVRFIGVSAVLPTLDEQIEMGVFDAFQIPYSAMQREHEDVITRASAAGAGIIVRGGVARGIPEDWGGRTYYMVSNETMRAYWETARLDELLDGMGRTAFLLRFTLSHPDIDTTIVGTRSVEHLRANLAAAARGPLPADVLAEAKARLEAAGARPAAARP